MANNLTIDVNINVVGQPSTTGIQVNAPTPLNRGLVREKQTGLSNKAALGAIGLAGRQVFRAATSSVGTYTGRNDLQRKINRGLRTTGRLALISGGFIKGGLVGGAITVLGVSIASVIQGTMIEIDRDISVKEAAFKMQSLGNIWNESRSD